MPSTWGSWTEVKLDALGRYLPAFARTAKSKARGRTLYLDLFAGQTTNVSRTTGQLIFGSPARALAAQPPLRKLVWCELGKRKAASLRTLRDKHPEREVTVLEGDCNVEIPAFLDRLKHSDPSWRLAPAFAFIDQLSAELHWSTLEALASFKDLGKVRTKVELWMYFGDSFIPRGLMYRTEFKESYARRVDALFGDQDWRSILASTWDGDLDGAGFKREMVNLMRWKLEHQLGYARTMQLEMIRNSGHGLYSMIFATDHWAGDKIMTQVLGKSEQQMAELHRTASRARLESRLDKSSGMSGGLFTVDEVLGDVPLSAERDLLDLSHPRTPWHLRDVSTDSA